MGIIVNRRGNLTTLVVLGVIVTDEIVDAIERFYVEESTVNVLWDFSRARFDEISSTDVNRIAQVTRKYAERREHGKTALVFSVEVGYGLGRMFGILQEVKDSPVQYQSFRSLDDAVAWLSVPSE